jgi:hypothetical protein
MAGGRRGQPVDMSSPDAMPTTNTHDDLPTDNTRTTGPMPAADAAEARQGVLGGDADRLDSPGEGTGGVPAAGADGVTEAREQLRKDLGERDDGMGEEDGTSLEQAAALGATDDPHGGSIQEHGSKPATAPDPDHP